MVSQNMNWCFTLNNYTDDNIMFLDNIECKYIIYGKEIGTEMTPHLQGFIIVEKKVVFNKIKELLPNNYHIESCKGSAKQNITYCKKQNNFTERGNAPVRGKRNDLSEMVESKLNKVSDFDLFKKHGDNFVKYYKSVSNSVDIIRYEQQIIKMKKTFTSESLRPWQIDCLDILNKQTDRQVLWICDKTGNSGKTYLAKHIVAKGDSIYFNNSKSQDIYYAYNCQATVVYDFCRSLEDHINYGVLEATKNGIFFSSKYESKQKIFDPPKIVIFANFMPDQSKLSQDRWCIYLLDEIDSCHRLSKYN